MSVRLLIALSIVSILSILLSYYLHDPQTPVFQTGLKYSDVVHGVFNTRFNPGDRGLWFNYDRLEALRGGYRLCPVPYVDYKFEYPPLVGLLFLASTCTGIMVSLPRVYSPEDYSELVNDVLLIHYRIQAIALSLAFLTTILLTASLLKVYRVGLWRALLIPLLPSTTIYLIYNWDVLAALFLVASLYFYIRGDYRLSGFMAGLSVSTKLLTVVAGLSLAATIALRDRRGFSEYTLAFLLAGAGPYALLYLISPRGFVELVNHHAGWYCENCIYMLLVRDIWSPLHRILAAFTIGFSVAVLLVASTRGSGRLPELLFASTATPIVLNYVFTPQMMLMITPVAVIALKGPALLAYIVADAFNSLIIVSFFRDLANSNPWTLEGLTQKIALLRNIILLALLTTTLYKLADLKLEARGAGTGGGGWLRRCERRT